MDVDPRTEEQARLLAESENLAVLSVLEAEGGGDCTVSELARGILDREVGVVEADEYERRIDETVVRLHHQKLPRLADAGLLEYDPEANRVTVGGSSVEWREPAVPEGVAEYLRTVDGVAEHRCDTAADGLGTVEGRDAVIQYGRSLVDEADSEIFCIYVNTELLRDECVTRVQHAIDRDVSVHIGSQNPTVRRLVRDRLPAATVWEPQTDWLNTPSFPRLGRLVLADRSRVMLAVLDEPVAEDEDPAETAIVGEGANHPLVVLVRDLLGPRLDHLDYQSDEFTSQLPT